MAGWFLVGRDLKDHWVWKIKEPFDRRSAWIDLLMLANFTDFKTVYRGEIVQRKRGDVNTSIRYLAQRWGWDKRKVNRYLMALESDGMVSVNSTTDGTTITIENYSKWQDMRTTNSTTDGTTYSTTDGTTSAPHDKEDIKKTKKKGKRNNNKVAAPASEFYSGQQEDLKQALIDFEVMRKSINKPMTDRARQLLLNKLTKLAGENTDLKIAILEQSIMNSWQGVFPIKEGKSESGNPFWDMLQTGDY